MPEEDGDPTCTNCPHTKTRHQQEELADTHCLVLDCPCERFGDPKVGG